LCEIFWKPRAARREKMLIEAWQESEYFNELRMMPGITCEGEWKNQPQVHARIPAEPARGDPQ